MGFESECNCDTSADTSSQNAFELTCCVYLKQQQRESLCTSEIHLASDPLSLLILSQVLSESLHNVLHFGVLCPIGGYCLKILS